MSIQTLYPSPYRAIFWIAAWLALALISAGCAQQPTQIASSDQRLVFQDCNLSSPGTSMSLQARCARLKVYEDRDARQGKQIDLNIAVIPAISRSPEPDPLFFLAGGPGQSATETFVVLSSAFSRVNQKRDIVLVDQRGTGQSNPLDCGEIETETGEELSEEDVPAAVQACLDGLAGDPRLYTTSIAMQDLEQVRQALGYEQVNLFGVSYGTRAALTYLQMFPGSVRTLVLDGVVPQDEPLGQDIAKDAQRALDMIFARCLEDSACRAAFPALSQEFDDLLERLQTAPVEVTLSDPVSGEPVSLTLTDTELGAAVRLLSYAPETAALLPLMIHEAAADRNYTLLAAQYRMMTENLVESISEGVNYAVVCSEDVPFIDPTSAAEANAGTFLGDLTSEALQQICRLWPAGEVPEGFKQPVQADTPALLLSGEADPVTPPENAEQVAAALPNSLSLVAAGQGHNIVFRGCIPDLVADFIESGSVSALDTTCVAEIQASPFFISLTGSVP